MDVGTLDPAVDKTQIPALHQKRILAFVNHFLISTCTATNDFALRCESKFIELERKLQKTEAALIILEAKLASIPETKSDELPSLPISKTDSTSNSNNLSSATDATSVQSHEEPVSMQGVRACEDVRYKKFFKMTQVGVPAQAVKLKMQAEGLEPDILDNPQLLLPDGINA